MAKVTYSVYAWDDNHKGASFVKEGYKTLQGAKKRLHDIQTSGQYYMATIREDKEWTDTDVSTSAPVLHWEKRFGITV